MVTRFSGLSALNKKLFRDINHLRGQVIATALVVACGVATYVGMQATYDSLVRSRDAYYSLYSFANVFASLKRAPESAAERIRTIPGVAEVQTRVVANVTIDLPELSEPAQGRLVSVPGSHTGILNDLFVLRGREADPSRTDEVLISGAFADANRLNPGDSLSAVINGRWRRLRIAGVALSPEFIYEIRPGAIFPDNRRFGIIWMNRRDAAAAFDMENAFNDVSVTLAPGADEKGVIERLDDVLEQYGGLGAYGRDEQFSHRFISNELGELEVFGTFIPAIFLGVTAFLLHMILSRLVGIEREQIGLLKAFGYSSRDIGTHYLKLAVTAILGGIVLGILLGAWIGSGMTALYADFFHFPILEFHIPFMVYVWAFVISVASAAIGAVSAVRKAVRTQPAEAMRPEPPADFRAGLLESLGFQRYFPTEVRMIVRNLSRHPLKALVSALGISLSVALLFLGFYFYDAINQLITVQFGMVQLEDAEVVFNEPVAGRAKFDLLSLPGVEAVETYRKVPVKLRFGSHTRRAALTGYESTGRMRNIVDKDLREVRLPPEGIVISKTLADSLGAMTGDTITVEVTEGARPVRKLKIADVVEEAIGLGVYMDKAALNKIMRESSTMSGAFLSVDESRSEDLYSTLKRTPSVAGVSRPQAVLDSFNETIAQTIGTSTAFMIGFACVIAFGIVYNGARIALSERGRELASLRVLGYTQREVGVVLLGEQAVITAWAAPIGWAIGFFICWLITQVIDVEIIRLPLVLSTKTFLFSALIVALAALVSGMLVAMRLRKLDLVEVLKTRE